MTAEALFAEHLKWACAIAVFRAKLLPRMISFEEAAQAARIALWDCAQRFSEDQGVKFKTFARRRIIGAVHDELRMILRSYNLSPRISEAGIKANFGSRPLAFSLQSPEHSGDTEDEPMTLADTLQDEGPPPDAIALAHLELARVWPMLDSRERRIVAMHQADLEAKTIAALEGVSPALISRILTHVRHKAQTGRWHDTFWSALGPDERQRKLELNRKRRAARSHSSPLDSAQPVDPRLSACSRL